MKIIEKTNDMSEREKQWFDFSLAVMNHLRDYTVPQYGDVGEDEITNYRVEDCLTHVNRYTKRYGSQSRDDQQLLDFMKIAHYTQCAWEKEKNKNKTEIKMEDTTKFVLSKSDNDTEKLLELGFEYIGLTYLEEDTVYIWRKK